MRPTLDDLRHAARASMRDDAPLWIIRYEDGGTSSIRAPDARVAFVWAYQRTLVERFVSMQPRVIRAIE